MCYNLTNIVAKKLQSEYNDNNSLKHCFINGMKVEIRLMGSMKRLLPEKDRMSGSSRLDIAHGTTLSGFIEAAGIKSGGALVVLVNGRSPEADRELIDGDVVAVFPPVAGG
jgi:molybdopterin converting factor small subunit